jgi:hypothetical protein
VLELIAPGPAPRQLLDPAELARVLGVSRDTIYEHAEALGGHRVGNRHRGRLRFDLDIALERWTHRSSRGGPPGAKRDPGAGKARLRRCQPVGSSAQLLPVHGEQLDLSAEEGLER